MIRKSSRTLYLQILMLLGLIFLPLAAVFPRSARAQQEICSQPDEHVSIPLTELGDQPYIRMDGQATTYTGGLYPDGANQPPEGHLNAALERASQIAPLDQNGDPDPINGKIVMISVGMSNAAHEFNRFMDLAHRNRLVVNPRLTIINGSFGGRTAERWVDPQDETWGLVDAQLKQRKVTPEQVQVVWVKQTLMGGGDFPGKALELQEDLEAIARNLKLNYPNVKIAYFSSRTRSYNYWRGLSPEPNAFETGYSVKWMVEKQINGDASLNYDPQRGEVLAPILLWGPYLWADGGNPRSDGLVWLAQDMEKDCTHPSPDGTTKVAEMLFNFFSTELTTRSWFLAQEAQATQPMASALPTSIPTDSVTASLSASTQAAAAEPTAVSGSDPTSTQLVPSAAVETRAALVQQPTPTSQTGPPPVSQSNNPSIGLFLLILLIVLLIFTSGWMWARPK